MITVQYNLDNPINFESWSKAEHMIFLGYCEESFSNLYDAIKFEHLKVVQILDIKNFYTDSKCKLQKANHLNFFEAFSDSLVLIPSK